MELKALDYDRLEQYVGVQSLLCDDRITNMLEWMVSCLDVADWRQEDGSANESGLAIFAARNYTTFTMPASLCKGAAVLYGCYVDYENRGTDDGIDDRNANQLPVAAAV